jgi:hypothetical protein
MRSPAPVRVSNSKDLCRDVNSGLAAFACIVKLVALALLIPPASSICADEESSDATASLARETVFALGGVGVAGTISPGESDLRALLEKSDAVQQLQSLLKQASPAGQLYALLGLRLRDRPSYEQALPLFRKRPDVVSTMRGCILMKEKMESIVQQIEHGDFDTFQDRQFR